MSGTFGYKDVQLEAGGVFGILQAQPVFVVLERLDFGESEVLASTGEESVTG